VALKLQPTHHVGDPGGVVQVRCGHVAVAHPDEPDIVAPQPAHLGGGLHEQVHALAHLHPAGAQHELHRRPGIRADQRQNFVPRQVPLRSVLRKVGQIALGTHQDIAGVAGAGRQQLGLHAVPDQGGGRDHAVHALDHVRHAAWRQGVLGELVHQRDRRQVGLQRGLAEGAGLHRVQQHGRQPVRGLEVQQQVLGIERRHGCDDHEAAMRRKIPQQRSGLAQVRHDVVRVRQPRPDVQPDQRRPGARGLVARHQDGRLAAVERDLAAAGHRREVRAAHPALRVAKGGVVIERRHAGHPHVGIDPQVVVGREVRRRVEPQA